MKHPIDLRTVFQYERFNDCRASWREEEPAAQGIAGLVCFHLAFKEGRYRGGDPVSYDSAGLQPRLFFHALCRTITGGISTANRTATQDSSRGQGQGWDALKKGMSGSAG